MTQNFARNTSIEPLSYGGAATRARSINRSMLLSCASLIAIVGVHQAARAQQATPIPDVSVNAPTTQPLDGSAEAGYRVKDSTAAGPIWNDLPVQDTPYSISVIPAPLIENVQAYQPEDLVKLIPQITNILPQQNVAGSGNPFFYVRGFAITQFTNGAGQTYDGTLMGGYSSLDTVLEDKQQVELLSGADAFQYGVGSLAGNLNFQLKRPTATPLADITLGNNAGRNEYVHADLGGPLVIPGLDPGLFGYRLNIVEQGGYTSILNEKINRQLFSGAFDIHPWDGMLVQLNASHSYYQCTGCTTGTSPVYTTNTVSNGQPYVPAPSPANPATIGAPSWVEFATVTDTGGVKITDKLNEIFTVRSQYEFTRTERFGQPSYYVGILNPSGQLYEHASQSNSSYISYTNSGYAFLDSTFTTFGVQHKLTTGFTGKITTANTAPTKEEYSASFSVGNFYHGTPVNLPQPPSTYVNVSRAQYGITNSNYIKNYILGDQIKFNDQWMILAGGTYADNGTQNFIRNTGTENKAALTPTASLIYKPVPWISIYGTYQQGLNGGGVVTSTNSENFTNAGTLIPYNIATSYEAGVKATVGPNLLLTAALFQITQAFEYAQHNGGNSYTEIFAGQQRNKGLELTATGKITDDLTLVGGFTAVDARTINNPNNPLTNGSLASDVSPFSGKAYVEYKIPYSDSLSFLQGLTLIGGFQAASWFYADFPNQTRIPGHIIGDLGFRYTTKVYDHPLTIRFNVNNFTNTGYYLYGDSFEGPPRTFLATAEIKW